MSSPTGHAQPALNAHHCQPIINTHVRQLARSAVNNVNNGGLRCALLNNTLTFVRLCSFITPITRIIIVTPLSHHCRLNTTTPNTTPVINTSPTITFIMVARHLRPIRHCHHHTLIMPTTLNTTPHFASSIIPRTTRKHHYAASCRAQFGLRATYCFITNSHAATTTRLLSDCLPRRSIIFYRHYLLYGNNTPKHAVTVNASPGG